MILVGASGSRRLPVRGEDVPLFVKRLLRAGTKVIGMTGYDLYREWCLRERERELQIIKVIEWDDPSAMFGKPTLCLLGPGGMTMDTMPRRCRVAVADKYRKTAKSYLNLLEERGFRFEKMYLSGAVETACSEGIADLAIDIVYSGSTIKQLGLVVYEKIFSSDFVVIGGRRK